MFLISIDIDRNLVSKVMTFSEKDCDAGASGIGYSLIFEKLADCVVHSENTLNLFQYFGTVCIPTISE